MRVDGLALVLRPRPMVEACDLGAALVRRHARSVWRIFVPLQIGALLLALCALPLGGWVPTALLFALKPWLDRSLLFVFSRAVFGQSTRWADLWAQRRQVWWSQWPRSLFWRRLSPWRAFTQPIEQLEGQRGAARRKRRALLLSGRRGMAGGLQFVFANAELALSLALLSLTWWFAPEGARREWFIWFTNSDALSNDIFSAISYAAIVLFLEPFYVAAGFAMYLNRRVELEAWDIEQEFRHAFGH